MKIIVSHDVDHLFLYEHLGDRFIPGLAWRTLQAFRRERLSIKSAVKRFGLQLHNIQGLHGWNERAGIKSSFFFGMANGLSLSYSRRAARGHIQWLQRNGAEVGLHAVHVETLTDIRSEKRHLFEILGFEPAGVRSHYLRGGAEMLKLAADAGFQFDSSLCDLAPPERCGVTWRFPISAMDVDIYSKSRALGMTMRDYSNKVYEEAVRLRLPYFVINFHDIYFSSAYPELRKWYVEIIEFMRESGHEFCTFQDAISELEVNENLACV